MILDHEETYTLNPFDRKINTNEDQRRKYKLIVKAIIETQLTDRQREIMLMHYVDGLSIAEIARELGIARMNVYRRMKAARKRINKIKKIFESVTL